MTAIATRPQPSPNRRRVESASESTGTDPFEERPFEADDLRPSHAREECDLAYRLSLKQYHAMIEQSIFSENDPVEFVAGLLVKKMPQKPLHSYVIRQLIAKLKAMISEEWLVDTQLPIQANDSEPEPDVCVIVGPTNRYVTRHPGSGDVMLVVEVADTSLKFDREVKRQVYASMKVPNYWIVNLTDRVIETFQQPNDDAAYQYSQTSNDSDKLEVVINGRSVGTLVVSEILPPQLNA